MLLTVTVKMPVHMAVCNGCVCVAHCDSQNASTHMAICNGCVCVAHCDSQNASTHGYL